nr:MAG TPA: hypothetical protein [Caudoviricetes sp.]
MKKFFTKPCPPLHLTKVLKSIVLLYLSEVS